jgi:Glutamate dehydrogenase/leucine dehydrogenase
LSKNISHVGYKSNFYCKALLNIVIAITILMVLAVTETGEKFDSLANLLQRINVSGFLDDWGPESVVQVYDPKINLEGVLVIDNTVLGPGKGRIRISPRINPKEIFELARSMTYKCSLADVAFGGAYAGIRADPFDINKTKIVRAFARKISPYVPDRYIAGPDDGVGKEEIAAFVGEIGDLQGATGKPVRMGGMPQEGTKELGIRVALEEGFSVLNEASQTSIAISGFDGVGSKIAQCLANKGAKIVAICDHWGTAYDREGIDIKEALKHANAKLKRKSVKNLKGITTLSGDGIWNVRCDVLILTDSDIGINEANAPLVKAKCVIEGKANSITPVAERVLFKRGILVLPDILVNLSEVIASYAEYKKMSLEETFSLIEKKTREKTKLITQRSREFALLPRRVAYEMAKEKMMEAMEI